MYDIRKGTAVSRKKERVTNDHDVHPKKSRASVVTSQSVMLHIGTERN